MKEVAIMCRPLIVAVLAIVSPPHLWQRLVVIIHFVCLFLGDMRRGPMVSNDDVLWLMVLVMVEAGVI